MALLLTASLDYELKHEYDLVVVAKVRANWFLRGIVIEGY